MAWTSKLPLIACACILVLSAYVIYDLNGGSFDMSDRHLVLVVSDSMDGNITEYDVDSFPANTLIMVKHLNSQEVRFLRVGDVVSYRDDGVLVQHRVIQVESDHVYLHGDNNHSTQKVNLEDVEGKVVGTNWVLGHLMAWIGSNYLAFIAAMFAICAVVIIYGAVSDRKKEVAAE